MTTLVQQMLEGKRTVHAVRPDDTVLSALQLMAEKDIGAVLVLRDGELAGVLSERDYARKVALQGKSSRDTAVEEVMTREVITAEPGWTCDQCMAVMTNRRIRHLPVIDDGRLAGIISIGDVVRAVVDGQQYEIHTLQRYIMSGG
jgi:CBS domain-containing protein